MTETKMYGIRDQDGEIIAIVEAMNRTQALATYSKQTLSAELLNAKAALTLGGKVPVFAVSAGTVED